ncbi:hypothetical protein ONZ43_g1389 [Nemania bipapillata]|uniref:Uncharacterized protein n=1 Tax=Nemania bipapillata TaxID=110536 RepID=A0ACC2J501_9PEZI|nr:hypothetical protein ONZ43_g1389 [Nemania bipapillata]
MLNSDHTTRKGRRGHETPPLGPHVAQRVPPRLFPRRHRDARVPGAFGVYAQPSPRYIKLIRDGAREHGLPDDYQAYLSSLSPYTLTQFRQRVGRILFLLAALPSLLLMLGLGRLLADDVGRTPRWLGLATTACMNLLWALYDAVFRPVFGDGERTMPEDEDEEGEEGREGPLSRKRIRNSDIAAAGEEKNRLLSDW